MSPRSAKPSKGSSTKRTSSKRTASRRATAAATPARQTAGPPGRGSGHASSQSSGRGKTPGKSLGKSPGHGPDKGARPGSERARDEKRSGGPRYGGEPWKVADERAGQRFGHARSDDADPSEVSAQDAESVDDDRPSVADPDLAAAEASGEIESGGRRTGMGRGEEPHRNKDRHR